MLKGVAFFTQELEQQVAAERCAREAQTPGAASTVPASEDELASAGLLSSSRRSSVSLDSSLQPLKEPQIAAPNPEAVA